MTVPERPGWLLSSTVWRHFAAAGRWPSPDPASYYPAGRLAVTARSGARPAAREMILFFDGPADAPQMPPEGVGRVSGASGQVVIESGLLAQCLALPDPASLVPLALPDLVRCGQYLLGTLSRDEHHAVVIGEDDVPGADQVRPEPRGDQRLGLPLVQPHRPGRAAPVTEDRKADRGQLRRVAVQAPHHQARDTGGLGLQHRQVADARLVRAATVVDDQHVAGLCPAKCLQEHLHAS